MAEGRLKSQSNDIKTIINFYEEWEKTREFFKMLVKRIEEARKHSEALIPQEESVAFTALLHLKARQRTGENR